MNRLKVALAQNGTMLALVVLVAVFTVLNPRFFTIGNAQTILLQVVAIGLVALPMAFLLMSGTLDLSVGSVASLSAVAGAQVALSSQSAWVGIACALLIGVAAGALNGFLIAYLELNALVITLGFLSIWGGLAMFLTNGSTIAGLPEGFRTLSGLAIGPVPVPILLLLAGIALAWFVLNRSAFGRRVLAVGGNARAARLMGINVQSTRFWLFVVTGATASLAGVLLTTRLQSAPPTVGATMEIQVLTVVLLGGVALEGGMGRISGVVAGLLFVGILRNGLIILGVSQFVQTILVGVTLVVAVMFDGALRNVLKRSWSRIGIAAIAASSEKHDATDEADDETTVGAKTGTSN